MQAKKLDSERQLYDLSQKMEELLQDKKELEIKNRILVKDLMTWQDHVEELWGREVDFGLACACEAPGQVPTDSAEVNLKSNPGITLSWHLCKDKIGRMPKSGTLVCQLLQSSMQNCHKHNTKRDFLALQAMRVIQQRSTLQMTADLIGRASGKTIKLEEALQWSTEEFVAVHYQARLQMSIQIVCFDMFCK